MTFMPTDQQQGGFGENDILNTYRLLAGLTPLISGAIQGFDPGGVDYPKGPSVLQNMVAQSIAHPGGPIKVSMADLMNPNILGLGRPRQPSRALPMAQAGMSALGALGPGLNLARSIFGAGAGMNQQPGGQAPQPVVGAGDVPQVNLGGGITMDQFPVEQPVQMSPNDLALAGQDYDFSSQPPIDYSALSSAIYGY